MKFLKGAMMGTVATATAIMIYTQMDKNKISKAIRKGKSIAKAVKKW